MFETYVSYYLFSQGLNIYEDFDLMDSIDFSADFNDILTSVGLQIPDSYDGTLVQKLYLSWFDSLELEISDAERVLIRSAILRFMRCRIDVDIENPDSRPDTPSPKSPKTKTPKTNTPKTKTPKTKTPKTKTPKTKTPKTETPKTKTPKTKTPKTKTPKTKTPKTKTPKTKTPKTKTPKTKTPKTKTPKTKTPKSGKTKTPKSGKTKTPKSGKSKSPKSGKSGLFWRKFLQATNLPGCKIHSFRWSQIFQMMIKKILN